MSTDTEETPMPVLFADDDPIVMVRIPENEGPYDGDPDGQPPAYTRMPLSMATEYTVIPD